MAGLFQPQPIPSNPTSQEIKTGNVNTWAQPYVSGMLNAGQDLIAKQGFTPLQTQSYGGASGIQGGAAGNSGLQASGAGIVGALGAGNAYGQMATNPSSIQAYMSPYIQSSLNPQLQEIQRQYDITGTQEMGNATRSGAFGGSREALMAAENQRNKNIAMNQAIGTGYNTAFNNAQQAQQYQNTLGLQGNQAAITGGNQMTGQGLGILGLQNQFGTQQQQYPYQQLNFMQNMLQGLPVASQTTQGWQAAPNVLSQIANLGTAGIAGMKLYDYLTPKNPDGTPKTTTTATDAAKATATKVATGAAGAAAAGAAGAGSGITSAMNLVPGTYPLADGGSMVIAADGTKVITQGNGNVSAFDKNGNNLNPLNTPESPTNAGEGGNAALSDQNLFNQESGLNNPTQDQLDQYQNYYNTPEQTTVDTGGGGDYPTADNSGTNNFGGGDDYPIADNSGINDFGGGNDYNYGGNNYTYADNSGLPINDFDGGNFYYADNSGGYDTSGGDFDYAAAGGLPKDFKKFASGGAVKGYAPGGIATLMNANKYTPAQIDSNVKAGGMPSAIGDLTKLVQANDRNNAMAAQSMAQPPAPTIADQIQTKSGQMEQQEIQQKLPLLIQALKAKISEAMQEGNMPLAEKYAEKLQQVQRAMQQPAQESPQASMPVVPQGIDQISAQAAPAQMAQVPQQGINAAPSNLPATMAAGGIARFAIAGPVETPKPLSKTEADMNVVKAAQEAFKNEDYFGASAASAKEYAEELKSQQDKAFWMALLSGSLAGLGGSSPYFGVNMGLAGKAGIDTLQKSQEQDLLNRKAILAQQVETDKAKSARGVSYLGSLTDTLGVGARSQTEANKLAQDVNKLAQDKTLNENLLANQLKIANIHAASGNLSGKQKMEHLAEIKKELEVKLGRPPTTSEILKEYTASTTTAGETAESRRKYDVEKLMIDWEAKIQYTANWIDLTPAQQEEMRNNKRKEISKNLLSQEANPTTPPPQAVPTSVTTAAGKTYNRSDYPKMTDAQWSAYVNSVKVK